MAAYTDKDVVSHWLRLHNRLKGETYQVESWPDEDSSKKNVDALCRDTEGRTLAIEHTLIEPYPGHKEDTVRFLKTLATLENHPGLVQKGYLVMVSQPVGAIPKGIKWDEVPQEMLVQLAPILLGWRGEGARTVTVNGPKWSLDLHLSKMVTALGPLRQFLDQPHLPRRSRTGNHTGSTGEENPQARRGCGGQEDSAAREGCRLRKCGNAVRAVAG